jgi:enoyl-CoA hydratase/carnithine racemase
MYQSLLARIIELPMVTVAAINGHAFAGTLQYLLLAKHKKNCQK